MSLLAPPPTPICQPISAVALPIRIRMPFGMQLESARNALNKIQSPDELLADLLKQVNAVLAPFAPILSLAGIVVALINFAKSVPDAITSLSPDPIISALDDLRKKALLLPQFIPGLPYVILILDVLKVLKQLLMTFKDLNQTTRRTLERQLRIIDVLNNLEEEDANLAAILDCNLRDIQRRMDNIFLALGLLRTLLTVIGAVLSLIEAFLPSLAAGAIKNVRCSIGTMVGASPSFDLEAAPATVVAGMQAFLDANDAIIDDVLTVVSALAKILGSAVGETGDEDTAVADVFADCEES